MTFVTPISNGSLAVLFKNAKYLFYFIKIKMFAALLSLLLSYPKAMKYQIKIQYSEVGLNGN